MMLLNTIFDFEKFLTAINFNVLLRCTLLVFIVIPIIYLLSKVIQKYFAKNHSSQMGMVSGKIIRYLGILIVIFSLLHELGFSLAPLLGAAGIVGIAVGFASQTTISNIISGIFLIAEQPFAVDDVIQVGDVVGQVLSVDILSIKIRTFDNKFVRIPNETILKGIVTNITYFPVRRLDIPIGISYKESVPKVRKILLDIAFKNPLCLQEPEAIVRFEGFANSAQNLLLCIWVEKADVLNLRNKIQEEIKQKFDEENIEIAFPHVSLYTGQATKPFPIKIFNEKEHGHTD